MSFVRVGSRNPPRKKRSLKAKPWNDTVNDLDAYKATPEEIAYRKSAHRSKHAVCTHLSRPGSARKGKRASPFGNNSQARKIAIMKEVLYDQNQLQEVLEKSDTMMAVVKDLFGDDPRRFAGIPAITSAPHSRNVDIASSLINLSPDIRTRSECISDSMMSQCALNQLQESDSELDESHHVPLSYQPKMNMQRFQQFVEAEEKNSTLSTISGQAGMSHLGQTIASQLNSRNIQSSQIPDLTTLASMGGSFQTPPKNKKDLNESVEVLQPPKSAMNDTNKINKTKRRVPKPVPGHNTSNISLNELRKVLETLEDEVAEYERLTGRRPPAERQRQETFSGYTLAIVDSVTRLTRYLRECELRLHAEITVREQLAQDVIQFRQLVDALTSDIILTQEEFHTMSTDFQSFRQETRTEIQRLKGQQPHTSQQLSPAQSMTSNPAEPISTQTPPVLTQTPPKTHQYQLNIQDVPSKSVREIHAFGDHLKPVSAAVMLSPPVRRSRVVELDREQQGSLLDLQDYVSSAESNNSALQEDFAALPGPCATSLAQVINPYTVPQKSRLDAALGLQGHGTVSQTQARVPVTAPVNSVNVPKPTSLVQSNVGIAPPSVSTDAPHRSLQQCPQSFYEKHQPISIVPQDRPQTLHGSHDQSNVTSLEQSTASERSQGSLAPGPDRDFLASQIAELNKQHAEAQRRLNGLMHQQQAAHGLTEDIQQQQHQQQQQQQGQQARQQVVENQQRLQQQQLHYEQQQKLIEMVMQQQQRIQEQQNHHQQQQGIQEKQQQLNHHQQQQGIEEKQQQLNHQQQQWNHQQQQQGIQEKQQQLNHHQQQRIQEQQQQRNHQQQQQRLHEQQRLQEQQQTQQNQRHKPNIPEMTNGTTGVRQSTELPGYRPIQKRSGLPAYPVSPNISPISQRSEGYRIVYQSVDSQNMSSVAPVGRGITVSIPKVDMDQPVE